ncbi:MAG: MFS transporter [Candidatus Eremiobacteraeota bacterium]|nr:MFS transporter [Candidatus Eremiobacteraeota bacterium]
MTLLATAHLADDVNQSFVPALLPYLILERHISHETAGLLVLCQAISSSVIQPSIGHLADRRSMPWLIPLGLLLAGGGVAALGVLPTFPLLLLAALASGIGVAMFHPEAARFANWVSGDKKASGMRWFTVGGNLGFAFGPAFATAAISAWGLHGTLVAAVPVALIAGVVLLELRRLSGFIPAHVKARRMAGVDDWGAFGKLSAFVVVRSMAYLGLVAFVPLYFVEVLHTSPGVGDLVDTGFLLAGALGTIAGGPIADRIGRKLVILWSTGVAVVLVSALIGFTRGGGPFALAVAVIVVTGFVLVASQAAFVVLGQEYLPNRVGLASGVTLGLAVSLGGGFTPVLGAIADAHGVAASLLTVAALLLAGVLIALTFPEARRAEAAAAVA